MDTLKTNTPNSSFELPPDPERVVEGLRDTGYDFCTAIADIVDNSVAAEANKIDIKINLAPINNELTVYISDDGIGMNMDGLKNAMRYGSNKRPDPNSLGKFGLGLKTASTAFCRKLSLVSRSKEDSMVRKVQWDLDYIAQNGWMLKILSPTEDEIDVLDETAEGGSGTVVVWECIDRLLSKEYSRAGNEAKAIQKQREKLIFHLSAVFQRFLDHNDSRARNIDIIIDGQKLVAWDPFCLNETETEKLAGKDVTVNLPSGEKADFILNAYALPRVEGFSTPEARNLAQISVDKIGFYVYRENRLIHYGDWLGMFKSEPHSSLLRVEFSFDYRLDEAFNIDIKKSRVLLADELFDYIKTKFLPAPKRAAEEKYRIGVKEKIGKDAESAHKESNKNIEKNAPGAEKAQVTIQDGKQGIINIQNVNGSFFTHQISIEDNVQPDECRVIPTASLDGNALWAPCIADQKHAVKINTSHPYYQKVYYPLLGKSVLVTGMDALLWALAEAELGTYCEETKEIYEDIRVQVSQVLKKLLKDLPEPEINDNEE